MSSAPPAIRGFADLGLPAALVAALAHRGITEPFPIQSAAMPDALAGRDLLGKGRTGSGKTLAFGLPLLARLGNPGFRRKPTRPRGLILVPTRELAAQVHDALADLAWPLGLRISTIVGGASRGRQIDQLRRGVDIVVACPGRLTDLINAGACRLDHIEVTILDEADHMCDLGFLPAVDWLLSQVPLGQRMLFSATLDGDVTKIVTKYLSSPVRHSIESPVEEIIAMEHRFLIVDPVHKSAVAAEIACRPGRTLLFTRTKHGADRLVRQLVHSGVDAVALHGNKNQNARTAALAAFSSGSVTTLVATDIAARGIHVDSIERVVHYDPPAEHKAYLHRSGRTARAGASGLVVTLAVPGQQAEVAQLRKQAGIAASTTRVSPGDASINSIFGPPEDPALHAVRPRDSATPMAGVEVGRSDRQQRPTRNGQGVGGRGRQHGGRRPGSAHRAGQMHAVDPTARRSRAAAA